jgi:hypothetical protein
MRLPNFQDAFIDLAKLTDYVLDPNDPRGRHKARVFRSALGISKANASELKRLLLEALGHHEAVRGEPDFYGQRYVVDCKIVTDTGEAMVRTAWIIRRNEEFPRLTTCYVIKSKREES